MLFRSLWSLLNPNIGSHVHEFKRNIPEVSKNINLGYCIRCKAEIKKDIIDEMEQKIRNLQRPKGFSCRPILIHINGVHEEVRDLDYFFHIIDFSDFLKK